MPGRCFRCKGEVHSAEEKLALGSSWHLECFTCAICNKTLDSTSMFESQKAQEIYCRPCYKKYYCIPGYGFGPTKPTLLSVLPGKDSSNPGASCPCDPCCNCTANESQPNQVFVPAPSRQGQEYMPRLPVPRHYTNQVVVTGGCNCCCDKGGPPSHVPTYNVSYLRGNDRDNDQCKVGTMAPPNVPTYASYRDRDRENDDRCKPTAVSPAWSNRQADRSRAASPSSRCRRESTSLWKGPTDDRDRPSTAPLRCNCPATSSKRPSGRGGSRVKASGQGNPMCQRCGREVFYAERVMGYRGFYHIRCFVCHCCGKTLDSTTVNEHQGKLYCKGCYKHKYATTGVGYGVGAGTLQTP